MANLFWMVWPYIQTAPRWMKAPALRYSALTLVIYTDGSEMDEGTSAGVFCPNPIIKHSNKINDKLQYFLGADSCNPEGSRNGK